MKGIIGAICGDIIGSSYEFNPIKTKDFDLLPRKSRFTDDTVMTLAVANWLLLDLNFTKDVLVNQMQILGSEYPRAGYGGRFSRWLIDENPKAYNSWGNGSAMRVSPVAWYANSLEDCLELARLSAEVTHNHPEGIKGALSTASAIFMARNGYSKDEIKEHIESNYDYDLSTPIAQIRPDYAFEVSCQKSVPEAITCFIESTSYEDAIRNAVSLGGDADTQAAIAGAIAAAYYDVPVEIYKPCISKLDPRLHQIFREFNEKTLGE
ncbi:MAG: ADP-ribosylglycohydrolase family protein [Methanosphaera sp.]|nr:ADP-ribosylglycohydrolase family protein [Methanosphaera sp.]